MDLQYFLGKICTISTVTINYRFKDETMFDYFMGQVEFVNDKFLWLIHPQTLCKSCIAVQYIVAIAEEQVLYEDRIEDAKIIEEYKKEKPISAAKNKFVDPARMAEMAKKAKESYDKS